MGLVSIDRTYRKMFRVVRVCVLFSFVTFLVSLVLPAIDLGDGEPAPGAIYLAVGALGPVLGYLEWLANPILVVANLFTLAGRFRTGLACSLVALGLMLGFHLRGEILVSETGLSMPVHAYLSGYWTWTVAGALAVVAPAIPIARGHEQVIS